MIAFLDGILAGKTATSALVDVGGVGFQVGMAQSSLAKLPEKGSPVLLYTYMQVRDDAMALYGFLSLDEKSLFESLITVSGVGPKVALAALSSYEPAKLAELIAAQDVNAVQRIPGIGKKMASRIILELKGFLDQELESLLGQPGEEASPAREGAREALLSMGFTSKETDLALQGAPDGATESALLQYALKKLGSQVS